ncbi:Threonyl/alanyl tRNA synthetase SAD [mine drainage metagenome]|uniref:Threonyl/alanyl tRNA synthetase SAD n=1 Tax=mine drainage metagenome TaxID=410659 RepID=T0ZKI5_9ZZZZ
MMKRESADVMVEKLYLTDSYLKEFRARVTTANGNRIYLDKTAFYPSGGGQPSDMGVVLYGPGSTSVSIIDVEKDGDDIAHTISDGGVFTAGSEVVGKIDWDRRYAHMRYHTALHIIDGVVHKEYQGSITGGQIYEDSARMDFDVPNMDKTMMLGILGKAQDVIDESHKVSVRFLGKEEALSIKELSRTGPGNDLLRKLDVVRVIDIEGFDMQMDGGTHVANTREVGKLSMLNYENKGSHNKRVSIKLD